VSAPSVVVPSVRNNTPMGYIPASDCHASKAPLRNECARVPRCRSYDGVPKSAAARVARLNPAGDWAASCGLCLLASLVPELDDTVAPSLHYALSGRLRSLIFLDISWHVVQIGLNDRDNRAGPTGASRVIKAIIGRENPLVRSALLPLWGAD